MQFETESKELYSKFEALLSTSIYKAKDRAFDILNNICTDYTKTKDILSITTAESLVDELIAYADGTPTENLELNSLFSEYDSYSDNNRLTRNQTLELSRRLKETLRYFETYSPFLEGVNFLETPERFDECKKKTLMANTLALFMYNDTTLNYTPVKLRELNNIFKAGDDNIVIDLARDPELINNLKGLSLDTTNYLRLVYRCAVNELNQMPGYKF